MESGYASELHSNHRILFPISYHGTKSCKYLTEKVHMLEWNSATVPYNYLPHTLDLICEYRSYDVQKFFNAARVILIIIYLDVSKQKKNEYLFHKTNWNSPQKEVKTVPYSKQFSTDSFTISLLSNVQKPKKLQKNSRKHSTILENVRPILKKIPHHRSMCTKESPPVWIVVKTSI